MSTITRTYEWSLDTQSEYDTVKADIEAIRKDHWTVTYDEPNLNIKVTFDEVLE